uniref:Uncharacterized protein n=1 Tax=Anopheles atroparvus TaxID=41427 RepID=A0A182JMH8_ANOAO
MDNEGGAGERGITTIAATLAVVAAAEQAYNLGQGSAQRLMDTEIPILPQSPSPPPQQRSSLSGQSQQASSLLASTLQPSQQHRPLLHGLLSGTHLPQGPYHRGYSTSSTVCPAGPFPYATSGGIGPAGPFELDDDGFLENIFHLRSMEKLQSSHHRAFLKLASTPSFACSSHGRPTDMAPDEDKEREGVELQKQTKRKKKKKPNHPHVAAVAAAAAATQQHLQQQHAHLQSGTFLRPNFYHHNSPPLRNIWNQRSVPSLPPSSARKRTSISQLRSDVHADAEEKPDSNHDEVVRRVHVQHIAPCHHPHIASVLPFFCPSSSSSSSSSSSPMSVY